MNRGWGVVDFLEAKGDITTKRGRLVVNTENVTDAEVALAETAVVLIGDGMTISSAALRALAQYDIAVFHCNWKSVPTALTIPTSDHSRVAARHRAQASLSLPRQKQAWTQIVKAKVLGQAANLKPKDAQRLKDLAKSVRSGDPANIEAQAAKFYWQCIRLEELFSRVPGGSGKGLVAKNNRRPIGGRNFMLDYGYTVLRGFGIRAVFAAGLSPTFGVHHSNRSNFYALVDDLIEPFRPAVDEAVFQLPQVEGLESREVRRRIVAAADRTFSKSGYSVSTELIKLAQRFGNYVEGDVDRLEVISWSGPVD